MTNVEKWFSLILSVFLFPQHPARPLQLRSISLVCATTAWPIRTHRLTPAVTTGWETPACLWMRRLAPWADQDHSGTALKKVRRRNTDLIFFSLDTWVKIRCKCKQGKTFSLYSRTLQSTPPFFRDLCQRNYSSIPSQNISADYSPALEKKNFISFGNS